MGCIMDGGMMDDDVRLLGLCSIPFAIALISNPSFLPSSLLLWLVEYIDDDVVGR